MVFIRAKVEEDGMKECNTNLPNDFINIDFLRVVELIATNNGNVNAQDNLGNTPLIYAVFDGCLNVVQTLVECGADVNRQNSYGYTALSYAALKKHEEIAEFLIECGAILEKQDRRQQ